MIRTPSLDSNIDGYRALSPTLSDSEDDFDPSQLLFSKEEDQITEHSSNYCPPESPAILNLQNFIRARSNETVYSPLNMPEPSKTPNSARESLVHKGAHLKNNTTEENISVDSDSEDGRFNSRLYSALSSSDPPSSSRPEFSATSATRQANTFSRNLSKETDPRALFNEESGSIHLNEITPGTETSSAVHKGLEEALLSSKPTRRNMTGGVTFLGQKQKFKDVPFLLLYIGFALVFVVVNFIVIIKSSQSSFLIKYASGSVYRAIQESLIAVSLTIVVSILVGLAWLASICLLTKPLLWFTFLAVPAASFLIFVTMLTRGFIGFGYQDGESNPSKQSKILSLIPLTVTIIHSLIIHKYHTSVRQAVEIIRMASVVLKNNIDLIGASLCCLASHILFSAVWLVSFDRLFLLGHEDTISGKQTWLSDDILYALVPFYVFFFWWTSNIINNIERCTIAGTVSQWYFHQGSNHVSGYNPTKVALRRSLTTSLGSLSLAGLLMTIVKGLKFARNTYERSSLGSGMTSVCIRLVVSPVIFAARIVEGISFFTVSYIGISGKPFLKSAQIASTILNRNFFQCLLANYVIRATIYSAIVTASTSTGFAFFSYSADSLRTSHTFIVGTMGLSISFFILKFMMNILLYTTDAIYLCYGIDIDQKTNHSSLAHRTLSQHS